MASDPRTTEQANIPKKLTELSLRFWGLVLATGLLAGIGAIIMMTILRVTQHLAFPASGTSYAVMVSHFGWVRRVGVLALGGLITGLGLYLIRNRAKKSAGEPTQVVWTQRGTLSFLWTYIESALSEVTVGMGGSIGREAAPQRVGAAGADFLSRRLGIADEERFILIACGAGAGLAAVYNVPFAGAVFALELYLGTVSFPLVFPALLASGVATVVSWSVLPNQALYRVAPLPPIHWGMLVFAVVIGPIMGVFSGLYTRGIVYAHDHRPQKWALIVLPAVVFAIVGVLAIWDPLILGNGRDLAQYVFSGNGLILGLLALSLLKPVATIGTIGSGASGGLFTPTLSTGAVIGALLGRLGHVVTTLAVSPTEPLVAAAAFLAAAMEAPLTAIVFTFELTHHVSGILPAIVLAVVGSSLTAKHLDRHSIYSGRLARAHLDASHKSF